VRQLRLLTLTICGLLCAAALARAHDMAFPGPPPGGYPPGAMMGGMYPGMQPVFAGPDGPGPFDPEAVPGPSCPGGCDERCGPLWSVGVEGVLWRRSSPRGLTLVRNGAFLLGGTPLLNADALLFDYEAAPRITTTLHINPELDCQFTYFTVEDWSTQAVVVSGGSISVSSPNILLDALNAVRFEYESELWSGELNLRWRMMPRVTLLAGVRVLELVDRFEQTDNFPAANTFLPSYTIAVRNQLFGVQAGGLFSVVRSGPICVDAFVKGGYFNNEAEHNMQGILTGISQLAAAGSEDTLLWEAGFNITYCFNRYLKAWVGYSALWLNGIASAPGQIPGNSLFTGAFPLGPVGAVGVDATESLRIEGANVGLELSY
jgi:hypothetical protein